MSSLVVTDHGRRIVLTMDRLLDYHGPGYPGGVAHAWCVMQRAFPLIADGPPERDAITIETAFPGPGARDAFEMATRAVTRGRFFLKPELAPAVRPDWRGRYFFRVACGARSVDLLLREGLVREEFIALGARAKTEVLDAAEETRLAWLKQEMADRLTASPPPDVYDVVAAAGARS